ncbi:MAG: hypothetical protein A3D24_04235 [Candidatus Blackburnbacteria bacterium RIFCSPHIGHO2_02_FULL_39_13]|uniref:SCP domain-containing protein n=1 Tax=Candidatus Blackburnbacteria bacterium RIFCSPLOWO2_01_FULL_40_20 TaxID=1797519 RepID=A0A1G1VB10_9BACT|nr:MAG: hypothetical protein UT38_C0002G0028 [Microgenomates group bacterium GW2011_GWA2_39_19]OGY07386.1 MAG: hypothetical protein A2694_02010 [Candidatus Blackburnbacteria bacterium RIFCSPHIGHO2_01_FULL_40_17]OGY09866.1 MAG: hypothetical protein A3D24_04235 [Candidatus Blackburnbacteria bacterium RIFCSPHIGHO2_02_FULL_39_13]OGY12461.1 MAG: hypothetical protein A3A77_00595 [Candidatus Blackburnbacteria bacterium RIFCSPLOWO2_01_FULL_40_20]HBL52322.1 hypothetical protein [Candidatus Blackburnbact
MPALNGNYIDLIIVIVLALYIANGVQRGFWALAGDLVSFIGSLFIAFRTYGLVAKFLIANFTLPSSFAKVIGFVVVIIVAQLVIDTVVSKILKHLPEKLWNNWVNKVASVVPALIDGAIVSAIILTFIISAPISGEVKSDITNSKIGGLLVDKTTFVERQLVDVFGGAINDTLTFLTVRPESDEKIDLNFKPKTLTVDQESEAKMLELVNQERVRIGVSPLVADKLLTEVARTHSKDMWERSYFAHINPDGKDPFQRMKEGGVRFGTAGENLALAPTLELAHQGLMNSPGHKRNILDPSFRRVGVGIIDGGIYGKMVTQDFAD